MLAIQPKYLPFSPGGLSFSPSSCGGLFDPVCLQKKKAMLFNTILLLHITSGFIALIAGLVSAVTKKGGKQHLRFGKAFVYAMYAVGISALSLTLLKANPFLMSVGFFTLYLTYSGQKAIAYFRLKAPHTPNWTDRLPVYAALLVGLYMVGRPLWAMYQNQAFFVSVSFVFGAIMLLSVRTDLLTLQKTEQFLPGNKQWLLRHIGMISGAYIAAFTAFLVTNWQFSPGWVLWLAPTVVGTAFITVNTRNWRKKLRITTALFVLLSTVSIATNAQTIIEGQVSTSEGAGIEYVNIGIVNSSIGTVSDQNGHFRLDLNAPADAKDILRFSAIGFESVTLPLAQATGQNHLQIVLPAKAYTLQPIVVKPINAELKTLGNTSETSFVKNNLAISNQPNMNLGAAVGRRFGFRKKHPHVLKEMNLYIAGSNYDTVLLRVNFYTIKSGKPHELINTQNITKELISFRKGWMSVNLEPYNLVVQESIIAAVEWIGASERGNRLFLNMNMGAVGATHYYKFGAQNKWKKFASMSTSMNLVVEMEKD